MNLSTFSSTWASRNFRWFYAGQLIGALGDQISPVALAFAVLSISHSASALGVVLAGQLIPEALLVLVGGVVADRWDPRRLMLITDLIRLVLQGLAAGLLLAHVATVVELFTLQVGYGAATAFFTPTRYGFIAILVPTQQLQVANSMSALSYSVSAIAGPAIGGILVAAGTPGVALAVDAATFGLSAAALTQVRVSRQGKHSGQPMWRDLAVGWGEFTRLSWVWILVVLWGLYQATVLSAYSVLGPVVAVKHFGGARAWAAVLTGQGIGALVAGFVAVRVRPRRPMRATLLLMTADVPLLLLLARPGPLAAIVAAAVIEGAALAIGVVLWLTALQQEIAQAAQSRVFAYDQLGSIAMRPFGLIAIGIVATQVGNQLALVVVAMTHVALLLAVLTVRNVRNMQSLASRGPTGAGS